MYYTREALARKYPEQRSDINRLLLGRGVQPWKFPDGAEYFDEQTVLVALRVEDTATVGGRSVQKVFKR